jgi:hypothetical protein
MAASGIDLNNNFTGTSSKAYFRRYSANAGPSGEMKLRRSG